MIPIIKGFDGVDGVAKEFDEDLSDFLIIIAVYNQEAYEGDAYVLARRISDGALVEVEASHCSCYGLERTWITGVVTLDYLKMRVDRATDDSYTFFRFAREHVKAYIESEAA